MKKWIKADNGRVTQVIEFDDGSKMELPLDNNGNLKWFDDSKFVKKTKCFSRVTTTPNKSLLLSKYRDNDRDKSGVVVTHISSR